MGQMTTVLLLIELWPKKIVQILDQKVNQRQNTVCLKQQIYASPEHFTPKLLVMLETFRRSAQKPIFFEKRKKSLKTQKLRNV